MIDGFMNVRRVLSVGALAVLCGTTVLFAQKAGKGEQKKADAAAQQQLQEAQAVVRLADAAMTGQPPAADFPIRFSNDFLRAQGGKIWIPMTLTLDPAKLPGNAVTLYLRVAPRGLTTPVAPQPAPEKGREHRGKTPPPSAATGPNYPYEDIELLDLKPAAPGQPIRIQRGLGIPPGSYDLYVVLHGRAGKGGKASVLKQPLDVPNYDNGEFTTSSVILAERVEPLSSPVTSEQQVERPYAFGTTEIVPSPDHKFRKSQELIVLFQIYNQQVSPEKQFNIEATYTFYRTENGTERRFNATEPQTFTPDLLKGTGYDPGGGAAIQAGQGIPLQSFPEGNYRLEIKITDKLSAKILTENANFTVTP